MAAVCAYFSGFKRRESSYFFGSPGRKLTRFAGRAFEQGKHVFAKPADLNLVPITPAQRGNGRPQESTPPICLRGIGKRQEKFERIFLSLRLSPALSHSRNNARSISLTYLLSTCFVQSNTILASFFASSEVKTDTIVRFNCSVRS